MFYFHCCYVTLLTKCFVFWGVTSLFGGRGSLEYAIIIIVNVILLCIP